MAVVLFLLPGGFFFAKGSLELADRFADREVREATLLDTEFVPRGTTGRNTRQERHLVRGEIVAGDSFEVDDKRVYELANGRTPLPVRVELSRLTKRVLAVRSDVGTIDRVGGASTLRLAVVGLVLGGAFLALPLLLPLRLGARRQARQRGERPPPVVWGAFAAVIVAAVLIVGGTWAWDLLR